jgi:hypothetical protein
MATSKSKTGSMHKTITNTEALDNLIMGIEKKPECCVCCDDIDKCDLVTTPCKHTFHNACLTQWLMEKVTCPICRYEFGERDEEAEEFQLMLDEDGELPMEVHVITQNDSKFQIAESSLRESVLDTTKIIINNIDEEDMADLWTQEGDSKFTRFTLKGRYEQIFVDIIKDPYNIVCVEFSSKIINKTNKKKREKSLKSEKWRHKAQFKNKSFNRKNKRNYRCNR